MARRRLNDTNALACRPPSHGMPRQVLMEQNRGKAMPAGSGPLDYTMAMPPPRNEAVPDKGSTLRKATDYLRRCDD